MSKDEFDSNGWSAKTTCIYDGIERRVCSISFKERLVGLVEICDGSDDDDIEWVRCENVHLN